MMMNYRAKQEEEEEEGVDPNDNQIRIRSLPSSSSAKMMNNTAVVNSSSTTTTTTTTSSRQWANFKNPRIVRVSRTFGGKDRHSKVCTVRGLRDRRIRLSVPTAIQLYDLQDRLGLSQPSKVVDWLLDATKTEIDKLPPLQMPPVGNTTGTINFNNFFQPLLPPPPPPSNDHDHDERRHQTSQEEFSAAVAAAAAAQNFFPTPPAAAAGSGLSFMNPYFQNMDSSAAAAAPNYLSLSQFGNHSCFPIQLPTGGVAADHHQSHSYFCPLPSAAAAPPQPTFPSVHSNIIIPHEYNNINHHHDHNNHHFQFLINNSSSSAAAAANLHNNNNIIRSQKEEEEGGGGGGRS